MKKRTSIFVGLFIATAISILIHSCCTDHYRIEGIHLWATGVKDEANESVTIVNEELAFYINAIHDCKWCTSSYIPKLISVSYATSCGSVLDNSLQEETFSLSLDRSFTFKGKIIPALSNLLEMEDIRAEINPGSHRTDSINTDNSSSKLFTTKSLV